MPEEGDRSQGADHHERDHRDHAQEPGPDRGARRLSRRRRSASTLLRPAVTPCSPRLTSPTRHRSALDEDAAGGCGGCGSDHFADRPGGGAVRASLASMAACLSGATAMSSPPDVCGSQSAKSRGSCRSTSPSRGRTNSRLLRRPPAYTSRPMRSSTPSCKGTSPPCSTAARPLPGPPASSISSRVPEKAETAHVGAGPRPHGSHGGGRGGVQHSRLLDGWHHVGFAQKTLLEGAGQHTDAQPLGEHQLVARLRPPRCRRSPPGGRRR